jgi:hypothetical protein
MECEATVGLPLRALALLLVPVQNGQAFLRRNLKRTPTLADGTARQVTQEFSGIPADVTSAQQTSCQILFLDLSPIFLLGLQVDLSEIALDITAVRGQGNLLCGLVGILDHSHRVTGAMEGLTECGSACFCDVKAAEERLTRSLCRPAPISYASCRWFGSIPAPNRAEAALFSLRRLERFSKGSRLLAARF